MDRLNTTTLSANDNCFIHLGESGSPNLFTRGECGVSAGDLKFEICLTRAIELIHNDRPDDARAELKNAYEIAVGDNRHRLDSCFHKLAGAYREIRDLESALDFCRRSVQYSLIGTSPEILAFHTLALLLSENRQYKEAIEILNIIREDHGSKNELKLYAEILNEIGIVYKKMGEVSKGNEYLLQSETLSKICGRTDNAERSSFNAKQGDRTDLTGPSRNTIDDVEALSNLDLTGLPEDISRSLIKEKALPGDVAAARLLLETALIKQFRNIANRLLANKLIHGKVNNLSWWMHYIRMSDEKRRLEPDFEDPDFAAFRQRTIQGIARREIRPIKPARVYDQDIVIYGGAVKLWEEGRINRQLASLGSSLRLLVVDSNTVRRKSLLKIDWIDLPEEAVNNTGLKHSHDAGPDVDGRFIFGEIGPFSAYLYASVFYFQREFATSPYFEPGISGFADQFRAVVRKENDMLSKNNIYLGGQINSGDDENDRNWFDLNGVSTLMHEYSHIRFDMSGNGAQGALSSWREVVREDICRFAGKPRTLKNLAKVFAFPYEASLESFGLRREFKKRPEAVTELEEDILDLVENGMLVLLEDDRLFCPLYAESKLWQPLAT